MSGVYAASDSARSCGGDGVDLLIFAAASVFSLVSSSIAVGVGRFVALGVGELLLFEVVFVLVDVGCSRMGRCRWDVVVVGISSGSAIFSSMLSGVMVADVFSLRPFVGVVASAIGDVSDGIC